MDTDYYSELFKLLIKIVRVVTRTMAQLKYWKDNDTSENVWIIGFLEVLQSNNNYIISNKKAFFSFWLNIRNKTFDSIWHMLFSIHLLINF